MISNLSLALTGEQAHQLADDKRRELSAHWGRAGRRNRRDNGTAAHTGGRTLPWARHRPSEC